MSHRVLWVVSILLTGCAAGSQFLYIEPNPETPGPGQGYVDFFVTTPKAQCVLRVDHVITKQGRSGGTYEQRKRVDSHAYLAELAQTGARLVRVATAPGPQVFSVGGRSPVVSAQTAVCPGAHVTVDVREGTITPVHLGSDGPLLPNMALDPIPYRRKESMPYNTAPGPDLELQLIQLAVQVDPNSKGFRGSTALMRAAGKGRVDYVKLLLAAHADPNIAMPDGSTALVLALNKKHADIAQLLLDGGANPNLANSKGVTALAIAVDQKNDAVLRALLKAGAKADVPSTSGISLLTVALQNRAPDLALALVNAGAPIDASKADAAQPLSMAAQLGAVPLVQALLARNSALSSNSPAWRHALISGIDAGQVEVVRALLDANPAPDRRMPGTPLVHAANQGSAAIVSLLIARKFDITHPSDDGLTPLVAAASHGNAQAARLLIEAGAPINARSGDGSSALMWAAQSGSAETVREFIAHRADANAISANGMTALAVAQEKGDASSLVSMLKAVTTRQTIATLWESRLSPPPTGSSTPSRASAMVFSGKEDGTGGLKMTLLGSDGKIYVTDVIMKSSMMIRGMGGVSHASLRGPILSGTLHAMDLGGHVLPLTAGMTIEQFQRQAHTRSVAMAREGFRGFRIGEVVVYFSGDKVGDISIGE